MKKRFVVIGLGILGNSVAKTLAEEGAEVIAVDKSMELVEAIKADVAIAVQCDVTDRNALAQLGVREVDAAIVCIGENFQGAVLATANLIDLGVKKVAVRAGNSVAASILQRIGAHDVFFVESEMGKLVAHRMQRPLISHELDLGGSYRIVQCKVPAEMEGKTLSELSLPREFKVHVVAIRSQKDCNLIQLPTAETKLGPDDLLLVCGSYKDVARMVETFKKNG